MKTQLNKHSLETQDMQCMVNGVGNIADQHGRPLVWDAPSTLLINIADQHGRPLVWGAPSTLLVNIAQHSRPLVWDAPSTYQELCDTQTPLLGGGEKWLDHAVQPFVEQRAHDLALRKQGRHS